jgi:hypothetical protein
VAPQVGVVYVDNDPIVLAHARALMASDPAGKTAFNQADIREPEKILADPAVRETLDLGQPVALMLELVDPGVVPVLAWRPDGAEPQDPRSAYYYAVSTLTVALASTFPVWLRSSQP